MAPSYRSALELHQKQQMSQSQIQSLHILSLDNGELSEFLQNEYIENPILDHTPSGSSFTVSETQDFDIPEEATDMVKTYLLDQLNQNDYTESEWRTMNFMIDCLDSGGFFRISFEEVSALLAIPLEEIKRAMKLCPAWSPWAFFPAAFRSASYGSLISSEKERRSWKRLYKITWTISPSDTSAPSPEAFISAQQKSESISP